MIRRRRPAAVSPLNLGVAGVALAVLLLGGRALSPAAVSADTCIQDATAIGSSDSDSESCPPGAISSNSAQAQNDATSPWTFASAWSRAENSDVTPTGGGIYASSLNNPNTTLGAALSTNDVFFSGVPGAKIGGSAYATATNEDSTLVAAAASNRLYVTNVYAGDYVVGAPYAFASNIRCVECLAASSNDVSISNSTVPGGVIAGPVSATANNANAESSAALAKNVMVITDVTGLVHGDSGATAAARNTGTFGGENCVSCVATSYNSLLADGIDLPNGTLMQSSSAIANNLTSSGGSAFALNDKEFKNVVIGGSLGFSGTDSWAINAYSPDSEASSVNVLVFVGSSDTPITVNTISNNALYSLATNDYCSTCVVGSLNDINVSGAIYAEGSIFAGGARAIAGNESGVPAPGFSDNTAAASNVVRIANVTAGTLVQDVGAQQISSNIVTGGVYGSAHNYTGQQGSGYCYECVAVADNFLKIEDSSSGESLVDTAVYATAENYNSNYVLAKSANRVVIKDVEARQSVIGPGTLVNLIEPSGVFAYTTNRYCDECQANADNSVLIKDNTTNGTVLNGSAYAWAENNLGGPDIFANQVEDAVGSQNTAIAYNTLIVEDNHFADPTALVFGGIVNANVYSCASNNAGGLVCGTGTETCSQDVVQLCSAAGPAAQNVSPVCTNCHAAANNYVKVTGDSTIDPAANLGNSISTGGVYAHAENTAQGTQGLGACIACVAGATNAVVAENASNVNGPTSSTAINTNSANVAAAASNVLKLDGSTGHAETLASNTDARNSVAIARNDASAQNGSTVASYVSATNTNTDGALALATGSTHAANGGEASSNTSAVVGSAGNGATNGVAIAASNTTANDGSASTVTVADLTNDGTSSGVAYSVSYDENGNVAVAVVVTRDGEGVGIAYTNVTNADATAEATADGSATQGGDISYQSGDPTASTSVSTPAP
ncbi:MAG: beta strand repeat-containing protein [Dehalococcoidia bacterium]